jgi:CheY-like chemotaxis protein
MPGTMNGLELTRVVRKRWPGVGVIISSGRALPRSDDLSDKVASIAKPYLPETIITLIQQLATPQVVEPSLAQRA